MYQRRTGATCTANQVIVLYCKSSDCALLQAKWLCSIANQMIVLYCKPSDCALLQAKWLCSIASQVIVLYCKPSDCALLQTKWNGVYSALVRINEEILRRKVSAPV
jgi:hypothetical protein